LTNIPPSKYSKTTSEKLLRVGGWALTLVGSFLLYFLADGAFTTILFIILMVIGIVMLFLSDRRINQLKKQKRRDSSREVDI
jgi:ABC-type multidrug transport system fused ATPase/permease subunit